MQPHRKHTMHDRTHAIHNHAIHNHAPHKHVTGEQAFESLRKTFDSGRTKSMNWRRSQLNALRTMLANNKQALCEAVHADLGKPAAETLLMEINLVLEEARFVQRRMARWSARHPKPMHWLLQPAFGWTISEPKGVVLVISPWNYPLLLSLEPMVDAIAAGNAVCLKPSELSPATSHLLAELIEQYMDNDAIAVVEGGPKETGELLGFKFNHIFYTGGGRVGRIVMQAAASNLTPVTLELGGKSPCFVDGTMNLDTTARRIAWGKFTNAGQTCVAPDYVLATPDIAEALAKRIAVAIDEFYGDDPKTSPDYGRIINDHHVERLCGLLPVGTVPPEQPSSPLIKAASAFGAAVDMVGRRFATAQNSQTTSAASVSDDTSQPGSHALGEYGAFDSAGRLMCGGTVDRAARYIAPTVLLGTQPDAPVMSEEIFGPILPIVVVQDVDEAIALINARPRPLAAYVFSNSREARRRFERDTSSGALGFGLPLGHLISSRLPFGGVGESGMGSYHGKAGFNTFSHTKTVVSKPLFPDSLRFVYPPFDGITGRLVNIIGRLS
ncbi:aldehyde dehydrogenase family protein [Bifidobacterium oedipodis]|uniref:Aldehyde dehydrogenase n=1 Tax=Bifidobacterium oedipodis TaxID=2675322 RepID=A0A7Y0EPI7_9BIFI|nr:aldehyde dehydrogenase family protein [Bifidobacterium sp. DSM 109957]NMM94064.1 aldehyde dehydrogenase [Bifidobacterium sp. DSM 109957]